MRKLMLESVRQPAQRLVQDSAWQVARELAQVLAPALRLASLLVLLARCPMPAGRGK
jgi:hypothetical protein